MSNNSENREVSIKLTGVKKMYKLGQIGGGTLQAVHTELGIDAVEQREDAGAEGDRHADAENVLHDLERGVHLFGVAGDAGGAHQAGRIGRGEAVIVAALVEDHVQKRHGRADGDAEDRAGRAHGQRHRVAAVGAHDKHRDDEPGDDLEEDLQHLIHRGGEHVAVALTVAAVGRDHAHQQDRRGHRAHAGARIRVFQIDGGEPVGEEEQDRREEQPQGRKAHQRDAEGLFLLPDAAVGVGLRHKARERHGQARCGQGEEDVIDAVGAHEHGIALVPEDIPERDLVEEAEQLHDDHAHGENGGAVQVVLALVFCHDFPPGNGLQTLIIYAKRGKSKQNAKSASFLAGRGKL